MHDPVILPSARRHGVADDDILHAYRHPVVVEEADEMVMVVGGDRSGRLLEVGLVLGDSGVQRIVHAMPARPKFLGR